MASRSYRLHRFFDGRRRDRYVAVLPSQGPSREIAASLHDTYYIVHRSKMIIFPLLLCMALCAAVALIGYTLTTQYVVSTLQHSASSNPKT